MQMQSATQKDIAYVTIPTVTTAAIFNRLGFAAPTESVTSSYHEEPTNAVASWGRKLSSFLNRYALTTLWTTAAIATYLVSTPLSNSSVSSPAELQAGGKSSLTQTSARMEKLNTNEFSSRPTEDFSSLNHDFQQPQVHSGPIGHGNLVTSNSATGEEGLAERKGNDHSGPVSNTPERPAIPNEPMKEVIDFGKFSTIDYISRNKIIGGTERGIFASEDGGKSWTRLHTPAGSNLHGVNFADTLNGIAVGSKGILLRTVNGGQNWKVVESGTTASLSTVKFVSKDTAYVCGGDGTILRTTTGGITWEKQSSGLGVNLYQFYFTDSRNGTVRGDKGTLLRTTNAGKTWVK